MTGDIYVNEKSDIAYLTPASQ